MSAIKKFIHQALVPVGGLAARLLPDKIPVTFVGEGATDELCESIGQDGAGRVLIVTDEGLVAAGIVGRVTAALDEAGVAHAIYSGVQPDPTFSQVEAGGVYMPQVVPCGITIES